MTSEQILIYGTRYSKMLDDVQNALAEKYYPNMRMLFEHSSPSAIKNLMKSMMYEYARELKDATAILDEEFKSSAV